MTEKTRIKKRINAQKRYLILKADTERYKLYLEKRRIWEKARRDKQSVIKKEIRSQKVFVNPSKIEELEQKLANMSGLV